MLGTGLPTGTAGTISELLVGVDLLKRGYEVFRALSPSCSCDLSILKDGCLLRVEVKTGYRNGATGNVITTTPKDRDHFDIFAIVIRGEEIIYEPELPL